MTIRDWAIRFGLVACLGWAAPACLLSATIELKTGENAIGTVDPVNEISTK